MRILYVTTLGSTMTFFIEHFRMLLNEGYSVELATNIYDPINPAILDFGIKVHHVPFSRSPLSSENLKSYKILKALVFQGNYDIVHCHTPNAAFITRLACRKLRKKSVKVVYTAHGFHFYKGAPLKNWILFYTAEKIAAHWTDVLVTINREDYALAQKKMKASRVVYIPGVGINLNVFKPSSCYNVDKANEIGISKEDVVFLSVGELNGNKNHASVINVLGTLREEGKLPDKFKYVICGEGLLMDKLKDLIHQLDLDDIVLLMGFREDVKDFYSLADAFIFPSFREGLSVSVMEAMASGLPILCSSIRGNVDLVDSQGGFVFNPGDETDIKATVIKYLELSHEQRLNMEEHNKKKIQEFSSDKVVEDLRNLYISLK